MKACWVLSQPLEFYVPGPAITPGAGVLLRVDATLPKKGPSRPVGLVREDGDGHFTPLDFN